MLELALTLCIPGPDTFIANLIYAVGRNVDIQAELILQGIVDQLYVFPNIDTKVNHQVPGLVLGRKVYRNPFKQFGILSVVVPVPNVVGNIRDLAEFVVPVTSASTDAMDDCSGDY